MNFISRKTVPLGRYAMVDIGLGVETGFSVREMLAVVGDEIQYRVGL